MDELLEQNKHRQEIMNIRKYRNWLFVCSFALMYLGVFFVGEFGIVLTKIFTFFDFTDYQSTFFKYYQISFVLCLLAFLISENKNFGNRLFFMILTSWFCKIYIAINIVIAITFLSISV